MQSSFLTKEILRVNRHRLVRTALILTVALLSAASSKRHFLNLVGGPYTTDEATLLSVQNPDQLEHYFVSLSGNKIVDTGFGYETVRKNKTTGSVVSKEKDSQFHLLRLDEKILLVKTKEHTESLNQTGWIERIPYNVQKDLVDPLLKDATHLNGHVLPMMLNATGSGSDGYLGYIFLTIIILLCGWRISKATARLKYPDQDPSFVKVPVAKQSLLSELEASGSGGVESKQIAGTKITKTWFYRRAFFGFDLLSIDDIMWVYMKVSKKTAYYVVPLGSDYALIVNDRAGTALEIQMSNEQATQICEELGQRQPGIIFGFSDEIARLWQNQRQAFIQQVDVRRLQKLG